MKKNKSLLVICILISLYFFGLFILTKNGHYYNVEYVPDRDVIEINQKSLDDNRELYIKTIITNCGNKYLGKGDYYLTYHLYKDNALIQYDGYRADIENLYPGDKKGFLLIISTPEETGNYTVEIDMYDQKHSMYLKDRGVQTFYLPLVIE